MSDQSEKPYICGGCRKRFKKKADRRQHWNATTCEYGVGTTITAMDPVAIQARTEDFQDYIEQQPVDVRREVFESVVDDDLPDGAYFAMAGEFGLDPWDLVDES